MNLERCGIAALIPALLAIGSLGCSGSDASSDEQEAVAAQEIQIISVSDWHGQLDPLAITATSSVGGAAVLSAYFRAEEAKNPNTLILTAGDSFGATPPLSNFFADEPTVLAMNAMGFHADGLGNHNFDRGLDHLARMVDLADFPFLSANLKDINAHVACERPAEDVCIPQYTIVKIGGVRTAIIGVTNPDAANLLPPGTLGDIDVTAPAFAANTARAAARKEGAKLVIALAHMGATGVDAEGHATGPLIDFAKKLSGFDVVLGDHTNVQVSETINGALVVENKSQGATYARIKLTVSPKSGHTKNPSVEFVVPDAAAIVPDAAVESVLAPFRVELSKVFDSKAATASGIFQRGSNIERLEEVPIGNLVADSLRLRYGAQLGFTNGGGIRAAIPSSYAPADKSLRRPAAGYAAGPPFDIVIGDAFAVLPFGNAAVTRTVTGAQVWAMMEHSLSALPAPNGWFGQISGFKVVYDVSKPAGSRVQSITLDGGAALPKDATTFTLATSDFIDAGGDGYVMLKGSDGVSREKMADVLLAHITAVGVLNPTTEGRITNVTE